MINYYLLTKPGIILGNLITLAAGFLLASKGHMDFRLFFSTLLGLSLTMASGCVFNNYIDRQTDRKMERTKNRALAAGLISAKSAIVFAVILAMLGNIVLFAYTNLLAALASDAGFFVYVFLYSPWKSRTIYSTAIGSIAGAIPPVVGYLAASNRLDLGAMILFAMMVLWQMPHFFSIALYRYDDYAAANIPVVPIAKGAMRAKIHMLLYILAFILTALMLTFFQLTGYFYLAVVLSFSLSWLALCINGFSRRDNKIWGYSMFRLSLLTITAICIAIPLDFHYFTST